MIRHYILFWCVYIYIRVFAVLLGKKYPQHSPCAQVHKPFALRTKILVENEDVELSIQRPQKKEVTLEKGRQDEITLFICQFLHSGSTRAEPTKWIAVQGQQLVFWVLRH